MDYFDYNHEFDAEEFLEQSTENQKQRLEQELVKIDEQLTVRDEIHCEAVDELKWKITWYTDRLETSYKQSRGKLSGERERLKNSVEDFYQELRQENRSNWLDQQKLEFERREIRREIAEIEDSSLNDLLGDP